MHDDIELDTEWDEVLASATEEELVDLAGKIRMSVTRNRNIFKVGENICIKGRKFHRRSTRRLFLNENIKTRLAILGAFSMLQKCLREYKFYKIFFFSTRA
jgi:hypothetical protein